MVGTPMAESIRHTPTELFQGAILISWVDYDDKHGVYSWRDISFILGVMRLLLMTWALTAQNGRHRIRK